MLTTVNPGEGAVPTVGEMVHYVSYGTPGGEYRSVCRAAVVASVGAWVTVESGSMIESRSEGRPVRVLKQWWYTDVVSLAVLNPEGLFFTGAGATRVMHRPPEDDPVGGTWHFLEECQG